MSKQKTTMMPRLRFPEFNANWRESLFVDVFDFHQTNTFSRNQMNSERGNVRNIHYGDVLIKYTSILDDVKKIPFINEDVNLSKFRDGSYLRNGDIVIADTAEDLTAGKAVEVQNVDCDILSGLHTMLCRAKIKSAPKFWGYFLNTPIYRGRLIPLIAGAKVSSISKSNILSTLVTYPDVTEQQKIADCLSSLDDLIAAEDNKLSALKAHKKGLMQKLFPAEGETVPEWRFFEFMESGEWKTLTLKKLCDMQAGQFVQASEIHAIRGEAMYPCYGGNGLRGYVSSFTHSGEYSLIGRQGALCGNITYATGDFHATEHAVVVTSKVEIIIKWLYYLLIRLNLNQYATGQAQPGLSVQVLEKIQTHTPKKPKEQQKIADCLSSVDTLIAAQSEKIEALKQHKKGLMQGLFPSIDEVEA